MQALSLGAWAALLTLAAMSAQAAPHDDIVWDSKGRFEHRHRVAAGETYELCVKLSRGTEVRTQFRAGAPVDFNVHHHLGKDAIYAVQKTQLDHFEHTLKAGLDQTYCWMWTHDGAEPVEVKVKLSRKP